MCLPNVPGTLNMTLGYPSNFSYQNLPIDFTYKNQMRHVRSECDIQSSRLNTILVHNLGNKMLGQILLPRL